MKKLFALLSCILLLPSVPALAGDLLIIPGQRIGSVSLGMTRPAVHRLLRAPRFTRHLPGAVVEDSWVSPYPNPSDSNAPPWKFYFVSVYFHRGRAVQVEANSPRFKTPDGLSTKSPAEALERRYRPSTSSDHKGQEPLLYPNPDPGGIPAAKHFVTLEDAVSSGIAWRYGAWGDLAPDPDPAQQEIIVVHVRGTGVIREPDAGLRFVFDTQDQEAAERRQIQMLLARARDPRVDINARDSDGRTLLMQAVSFWEDGSFPFDHPALVRRILARHPDINARDSRGDTVLMQAIGLEGDLIPMLLSAGADVNVRNKDGATPLIYAVRTDTVAMVKLLLAHGADPDAQDNGGGTALLSATRSSHGGADDTLLLLEHGADVNAVDAQGQTPLMAAAADGLGLPIVKLLLAHGANVNTQDADGKTALMDCVSSYPSAVGTDIAPLLVAHGTDMNLRDRHGETALTLAEGVNFDNARMVRFLRNRMTAGSQ